MNKYNELNLLNNFKRVCIITHLEPDCDALASSIVFANFLTNHFSLKVDIFAEFVNLPENYNYFLQNTKLNPKPSSYDAAIMLDAPNSSRLGKYKQIFEGANKKIVIDHHATNNFSGDINIVEYVSSTCEIIYKILKYFNFPLDQKLCELIYAGIATDTNNFMVGNFSANTFKIVGSIANKFDVQLINQICFTNTLKSLEVLARAIENIEVFSKNKVIFSKITKKEAQILKIEQKDYEGIINKLATVSNCMLVCFIYPKNNQLYVSLRAKKPYDVAQIALKYDGGGHKGAAAFNSDLPLDKIKELVLKEFNNLLST